MSNALARSQPCPQCGADVLWTQNSWKVGDTTAAAYVCADGMPSIHTRRGSARSAASMTRNC